MSLSKPQTPKNSLTHHDLSLLCGRVRFLMTLHVFVHCPLHTNLPSVAVNTVEAASICHGYAANTIHPGKPQIPDLHDLGAPTCSSSEFLASQKPAEALGLKHAKTPHQRSLPKATQGSTKAAASRLFAREFLPHSNYPGFAVTKVARPGSSSGSTEARLLRDQLPSMTASEGKHV